MKKVMLFLIGLLCVNGALAYVYDHTGIYINGQLVGMSDVVDPKDSTKHAATSGGSGATAWNVEYVSAGAGLGRAWEIQLKGAGPYTISGTAYMQTSGVAGKDGNGGFGHSTWIRPMVNNTQVLADNLTLSPLGRANCPTSTNAAFRVAGNSSGDGISVTLKLKGENLFLGGKQHPAVEVAANNTLTIASDYAAASLCVTGGVNAAGIGVPVGASFVVSSGVVTADGGSYAAGIGGGSGQGAGTITFDGGTVKAYGGFLSAAGIGGGYGGAGGSVYMNGGDVYAMGGPAETAAARGMDIGRGYMGAGTGYLYPVGGHLYMNQESLNPSLAHPQARMGTLNCPNNKNVYLVTLRDYDCVDVTTKMVAGMPYMINGQVDDNNLDPESKIRCVSAAGVAAADRYDYYFRCNSPMVAHRGVKGEGLINVWLPNGTYTIACGNYRYRGTVSGKDVIFTPAYTTFDAQDNADPAKTTKTQVMWRYGVSFGALAGKPSAPSRDGYKFLGWYNSPTVRSAATEISDSDGLVKLTKDMTVYAHWAKLDDFENGSVNTEEDSDDPADGKISLREKITWCSEQNYWTTVDVASSVKQIALTQGSIVIGGGRINFKPSNGMTLVGDGENRIFAVTGGVMNVANLTMSNRVTTAQAPKGGGAVLVSGGGRLTAENCRFADNRARGLGGAVYVSGTGSFTARSCTFYNNAVEYDGGDPIGGSAVAAQGTDVAHPAEIALIGCSLAGNTDGHATTGSGAIRVKGAGARAVVANVTCAANDNGGLYADGCGPVYVLNSIFAKNNTYGRDLTFYGADTATKIINCLYEKRYLDMQPTVDVSAQTTFAECLISWTSTTVKSVRHSYYKPTGYALGTGIKVLANSDPWKGLGFWACRNNGSVGYKEYLIGTSASDVTTDLIGASLVKQSGTEYYYPIGAIAVMPTSVVNVAVAGSATEGAVVSLNTFGGSEPATLKIPEIAQGLVIRKVAEDTFNSSEGISKVYLPKTMVNIGNLAFANCTALADVRFLGTEDGCPSMIVEEAFANTPWFAAGGLLKDASGKVLKKYYATYTIAFDAEGGVGDVPSPMTCVRDRVYALPKANLVNEPYIYTGWGDTSGKRYDNGILIFNLAEEGATNTLHAVWEKP